MLGAKGRREPRGLVDPLPFEGTKYSSDQDQNQGAHCRGGNGVCGLLFEPWDGTEVPAGVGKP